MPDETLALNITDLEEPEQAEQITEDEAVEQDEGAEETDAEDQTEETDAEQSETDEGGDEESTADWGEFMSQFDGMPDSIDSPEKLAESYIEMLKEMKRGQSKSHQFDKVDAALRERGIAEGVEGLLSGAAQQGQQFTQQSGQPFFNTKAATEWVDKYVKGRELDEDAANSWRAVASMMDATFGEQLGKAEQVYTTAMGSIVQLAKRLRQLEWNALPDNIRTNFKQDDLEQLIGKGLFETYDEAAEYRAFKNPNLLAKLTAKAEQRGEEKGRKKFKRFNALRKTKSQPTKADWQHEKYLNDDGTWDMGKLVNKFGAKKAAKLLDDFEKEHFKK